MSRLLIYALRYVLSFIPGFREESIIRPKKSENTSLVILGNGPGLKNYIDNPEGLDDGADYMCVNLFALSDRFEFFRPSHYVIFDPQFVVGLDEEESVAFRVFTAIRDKVDWPLTLYIPLRFRGHKARLRELIASDCIEIVFFRDAGFSISGNAVTTPLMRTQVIVPKPQNVLVAAIYVGMMSQYQEIFLEGADHSWHKYLYLGADNLLMIQDVHFYDENPKRSPFLKDTARNIHFTMEEIFLAFYRVHKSYGALRQLADAMGVRIINRTPDSFIDSFDKALRET